MSSHPKDEGSNDALARDLARLPAPAIDPAFAARVRQRARGAARGGFALRLDEAAVPALLLVAGVFYAATAFEQMLRIFTTS